MIWSASRIAAAIGQNVPVVPVFVRGARMPLPEDLPLEIRGLARRNGLHLAHEQWAEGVQRLSTVDAGLAKRADVDSVQETPAVVSRS